LTLSEIARRIEAARPGTLPTSIRIDDGQIVQRSTQSLLRDVIRDDIARHMLIGAMVMATGARRGEGGWSITLPWLIGHAEAFRLKSFLDSDHGNDPLRSLLAAFERVYLTNNAPQAQKD